VPARDLEVVRLRAAVVSALVTKPGYPPAPRAARAMCPSEPRTPGSKAG